MSKSNVNKKNVPFCRVTSDGLVIVVKTPTAMFPGHFTKLANHLFCHNCNFVMVKTIFIIPLKRYELKQKKKRLKQWRLSPRIAVLPASRAHL